MNTTCKSCEREIYVTQASCPFCRGSLDLAPARDTVAAREFQFAAALPSEKRVPWKDGWRFVVREAFLCGLAAGMVFILPAILLDPSPLHFYEAPVQWARLATAGCWGALLGAGAGLLKIGFPRSKIAVWCSDQVSDLSFFIVGFGLLLGLTCLVVSLFSGKDRVISVPKVCFHFGTGAGSALGAVFWITAKVFPQKTKE